MKILFSLNIINTIINILFIKKYLHIFQLKDYNSKRYIKFFIPYKILFQVVNICTTLLLSLIPNLIIQCIIFTCSIVLNILFNINLIKQNKTPIRFTNKLKRLYVICLLILIFSLFIAKIYAISSFLLIFTPIFANFINIYDKIKNFKFIKLAQKKLKASNAKIIAITGSNGKTSVKNILHKMLEIKYNVLSSPHSYNTPLGLSKFINNSCLINVNYIILEYGARNKNDIKNLCKIFGADYGIITTISPQHLETFKNINNIYLAKKELSNYLKNNLCVFNLDNEFTKQMFNEKQEKKLGISINTKANIYADNILFKNFKTEFDLHCLNSTHKIQTSLLGKHNIANILLSFSLAKELNIEDEKLVDCIKKLEPTPHRLEYINGHIHILDDSYNCSISSAIEAINVLSQTPNKKMILTPGIIEGGKQQFNLNYDLGKMCNIADYLVIVGETNKKAILAGLKSHNYKTKIFFAKDLEASKQLFSLLNKDDTLLILNDLPDDYN